MYYASMVNIGTHLKEVVNAITDILGMEISVRNCNFVQEAGSGLLLTSNVFVNKANSGMELNAL